LFSFNPTLKTKKQGNHVLYIGRTFDFGTLKSKYNASQSVAVEPFRIF